ncbi:hypothetical protein [Butyrivibrio sp. MC2021]|uniref:hypothetical protein n=1 Tax=Butyrivibrio sp. MC2021 TaxID=1408306 RepID=UPI0006857490|nr:hypothetical protein [Butyrivibrio sp. MC2021]
MNKKKNKIDNKNYKDTVFRLIFKDRQRLLELYNAMNGTNYTNAEDLTITTIEGETYLKMKNDVSFVFYYDLSLFEHQSSPCPNIPLRDLFYVAEIFREIVDISLTYKAQLLKIPTPRFVVFYNGTIPMEDEKVHRLSDMYENKTENPELELVVKVLNINEGHNKALLDACKSLRDYSIFVGKVRKYISEEIFNSDNDKRKEIIRLSVAQAIDECINENVLKNFFLQYRKEVVEVSVLEYSAERHIQVIGDERYEEGRDDTLIALVYSV